MKANRKFVQADEAVSPVIAVILMVAITVVLAATVFVLVSDIGGQNKSAPSFNLAGDDTLDRLKVDSAASNADWNRLQITVESSGDTDLRLGLNVESDLTTGTGMADVGTASTWVEITGTSDTMLAGEFLDFCGLTADGTAGEAKTDVKILIKDATANQNMGDWVLSSIAACA